MAATRPRNNSPDCCKGPGNTFTYGEGETRRATTGRHHHSLPSAGPAGSLWRPTPRSLRPGSDQKKTTAGVWASGRLSHSAASFGHQLHQSIGSCENIRMKSDVSTRLKALNGSLMYLGIFTPAASRSRMNSLARMSE